MPTSFLSVFAQQAADLAIAAFWQGSIIAAALAICLRLVPRTSAQQRFTLWAAAFATIASLPVISLLANLSHANSIQYATSPSPASTHPVVSPLFSIDARWSFAIAAIWAAIALFRVSALALHFIRLRKIWKQAIPVDLDINLSALLAESPKANERWPVQVCTTTTLQRPCVIGFFKPRILIPDWLFARLTEGELQQIVLHEAEHLRRRDDWTNLFQKLCLALFPLNPALLWIERRLCREREMACDDGVIAVTHAPRAYAACLASLAERGLQHQTEALSLGAWQRRPELVYRVHSILRCTHTMSSIPSRILLGALGCSLFVASVSLARCPQLIAFVSQPEPAAASFNLAFDRSPASPKMVNTSYAEPITGATHRFIPNPSTKPCRAHSSANGATRNNKQTRSIDRTAVQQNVAFHANSQPSSAHSPRLVLLNAESANSQPAPLESQLWFIVTTTEQVETQGQTAALTSDYTATPASESANKSAAATASASIDNAAHATPGAASQITVTRLIFKIYPATSISNQPTTLPIRGGWFVLQL